MRQRRSLPFHLPLPFWMLCALMVCQAWMAAASALAAGMGTVDPAASATLIPVSPPLVPLLVRELRSENGELLPLQPEMRNLLNYFEHELQIRFELRRYPWNRLLANGRAGEGLVFGLSKTRERLGQFRFSDPVFASYVWLVTRSDRRFVFKGMADLQGKTIGVARGASYGDDFDGQRGRLFKVEEDVSSYAVRLKKLMSGRMDAMLVGDRRPQPEQMEAFINRIAHEQVHDMVWPEGIGFSVLPQPLLSDDLHFAIAPEKDDGIIARLNAALLKARQSGQLNRILFPK
jgi:ABC-type amino acid transport substrate-binding protein